MQICQDDVSMYVKMLCVYGWVHTSACLSLCMCSALHDAVQVCVCVFVKCLRTLMWMSECMCDTVLPECHTENWVLVVLQAKTSCSLFSNKPNGGKTVPTATAASWDSSARLLLSLS